MRKRLIVTDADHAEREVSEWLDLERISEVELTSEDSGHQIESALAPDEGPGWRASTTGEQLIRIIFDEPQRLRRIRLVFEDPVEARTQEFVLRWAPGLGEPVHEIVRQQWNFHPHEATREVEVYHVDLSSVRILELAIVPDVSGRPVRATMRSLQVA
jgi:hypothetical protein